MRYVEKKFLSDSPDESGSLFVSIDTPLVKDIGTWAINNGGSIGCSLQLRDCHKQIVLDFCADGQKQFEQRLDKMDGMIHSLQQMRKQYHEMWWSHQRDIEFKKQQESK